MKTLAGCRVSLRPLIGSDAEGLFSAVDSSRRVLKRRLRWVAGISSIGDCRAFIQTSLAEARCGAHEVFAVVERGNPGILAGSAALQGVGDMPRLAEISGWIRSDRSGRGYATQALRLLVAHALRQDVLHKFYARIDPANRAARKVFQKAGFRYEGCLRHEKRLNGRWINQECWGLLRGEWGK